MKEQQLFLQYLVVFLFQEELDGSCQKCCACLFSTITRIAKRDNISERFLELSRGLFRSIVGFGNFKDNTHP